MSLLELDRVRAGYGPTAVLHGVSFAVEPGEVIALLGRNGMGKSTTISAIAGLVPATNGKISFAGRDVTGQNCVKRARNGIALVPETRQVFKSCTVREHLTMAARTHPDRANPWTLERIYATFPVLGKRAKAHGTELSGGEQQMLAIARALSSNPDLLLLDEPSEGLAPAVVHEIGEVIRQLAVEHSDGGIVLVEQNVALALSIADRVLVMSHGEIVFTGTVEQFSADPEITARYIGVG